MKYARLSERFRQFFVAQQPVGVADSDTAERAERSFLAMGTIMRLIAYGPQARAALADAEATIMRLDSLLSRMRLDSEITQINASDGISWVAVQEETDAVLREALRYAESTNGVYDPAIGALVDVWAINKRERRIPDLDAVSRALASCDYHNIESDNQMRYRIHHHASIDLGGIGKGYAADRIYRQCQTRGITSALFSLGTSSIAALGAKPDGTPWKVGLKAADAEQIACFGVVRLRNQFLSTSGSDEQGFVKEGRRYHHLLDKETGYPAESGLRSVTVIADNGAQSEAYSTALFLMGMEAALRYQQRIGGFEAILVTTEKQVVCTPGARAIFEFKDSALSYGYRP